MKINKILLLSSLLLVPIILSCSQNEDSPQIKLRASLLSSSGGDITAYAFPENSETGNIVTGAVVLIYNSANEVTELSFDNSSQCYKATLSDTLEYDTYTVVASSSLCNDVAIAMPHKKLSEKPVASVFEDSDGNSVLKGNELDSALPIQISWNRLGDNVVYKVAIQSGLATAYVKSTQAPNITVPAGVLKTGGSYYMSVTAQCIKGDPYFKSEPYYSASSIKSAGVSFNVQ